MTVSNRDYLVHMDSQFFDRPMTDALFVRWMHSLLIRKIYISLMGPMREQQTETKISHRLVSRTVHGAYTNKCGLLLKKIE